ncbi:ribonuclease H1 [Lingula anatina]|uniref:Ribonuclease H1 n=1 Tax=Lingula anatina TaxID=7574 RepID=A0A1S3IMK3_LINAN|nr:ribonuclease H1 [Lingula anatina]|eukprot:XP_013399318.1 ribonuclease H1 [Lingula anatina]
MLKQSTWTRQHLLKTFLNKMPFYAVRTGKRPGVYNTWPECQSQVKGFPNARYKKFDTKAAAWDFVHGADASSNKGYNSNAQHHSTAPKSSGSSSGLGDIKMQLNLLTTTLVGCRVNLDTTPGRRSLSTLAQKQMQVFLGNVNRLETEARELSFVIDQEDSGNGSKRPSTSSEEPEYKKMKKGEFGDSDTGSVVIVYTDGACINNGKENARAGIGVYWGPDNPMNVSERLPGKQTNNRAEIHAAVRAIQQAKEMGKHDVIIRTDSMFLINSMTQWIEKWRSNGWKVAKGAGVLNKDDFLELERVSEGMHIKWEHVPAHVGIEGNEAADHLANEGAAKPLKFS